MMFRNADNSLAESQQSEKKDVTQAPKNTVALLQATARANLMDVLDIIIKSPTLALEKSPFKECWGTQREWKSISALQYAAWAGDVDLINEMIQRLTSDDDLRVARAQLLEIQQQGTEHGPHLSAVKQLQHAYRMYLYSHYEKGNERKHHDADWIQSIGQAQLRCVRNFLATYFTRCTYYQKTPASNSTVTGSLGTEHGRTLESLLRPDSSLGKHTAMQLYETGASQKDKTRSIHAYKPTLFRHSASLNDSIDVYCKRAMDHLRYLIEMLTPQATNTAPCIMPARF